MENLSISVWDLLGLALGGLVIYMLVSRLVVPRFTSPWVNKRRRQEAIEKAEKLLESSDLDDEMRYRLQRCLVTVRSYDTPREGWTGRVPISDVVNEIDQIWDEHQSGRP